MYTETAILPYMLNHFKFVGSHTKMDGCKYAGHSYNALDLWVEQRTPAQLKAVVSVDPSLDYLMRYFARSRPAFRKIFPNLQALDLRAGQALMPRCTTAPVYWTTHGSRKDVDSDLDVTLPTETGCGWDVDDDLVKMLKSGPNHFDTVIRGLIK